MAKLAVIIVSWNTCDLLRRCIASVAASLVSMSDYEVVVVDNASSDGTPQMLRGEYPAVRLIESGSNLGFAGGNNLALRTLLAEPEPPELFLLLNPDTDVIGDAIPQLVAYLEQHPDVAVVGPQLRYADGTPQPSRRRFPTRGVYFFESTPLEQYWPNNHWARRYRLADRADDSEQRVDWLVGAALLVRRSVIASAGLLDAGFAMYSEELEWQRRIHQQRAAPHAIAYLPQAVIIHHEGKSSEQAPAQRYINFQRSRLRDARLTYGPQFALLLRAGLLSAYAGELAIESGKWLLGHRRALRAERIRVYREVLAALL